LENPTPSPRQTVERFKPLLKAQIKEDYGLKISFKYSTFFQKQDTPMEA
jgi:hypothetical protein